MTSPQRRSRTASAARLAIALCVSSAGFCTTALAQAYQETDLVSDLPGRAALQDPNLVNAWGISFAPGGPFWISNNGTGTTTLYGADGAISSLVVNIPVPTGAAPGSVSTPTGQVFSGASGVVTPSGSKAAFVFAAEDGTLTAWAPANGTHAVLAVDNSNKGLGSAYKGLEIAQSPAGTRLYATDFHNGAVDVFDSHFNPVTLGAGAFTDPNLPASYAPFNVLQSNNKLLVTYVMQDATKHDDVAGPGHGIVDVYGLDGTFDKRLITGGALNSPWGMATAPSTFGALAGSLLVGNFGDGKINAFNPTTGALLGTLTDSHGQAMVIDGLWGLSVRDDLAGAKGKLYFTAGLNGEANGLFGVITAVPEPANGALLGGGLVCVFLMRRRSGQVAFKSVAPQT